MNILRRFPLYRITDWLLATVCSIEFSCRKPSTTRIIGLEAHCRLLAGSTEEGFTAEKQSSCRWLIDNWFSCRRLPTTNRQLELRIPLRCIIDWYSVVGGVSTTNRQLRTIFLRIVQLSVNFEYLPAHMRARARGADDFNSRIRH